MRKLCVSPPLTSCVYQRLARDQAPDEPGAQAGAAASQIYEELCQLLQENLSPDVLGQAQSLLKHFIDKSGDGLAADEPEPFSGRPRPGGGQDPLSMDSLLRRVEVGRQVTARKALARNADLENRFPGISRIRVVG